MILENGAKECIVYISTRAFQRVFTCTIWLRYSRERALESLPALRVQIPQVNANAERLDMEHTFLPIKWPDQEADPDPGFVEVSLTVLMQQEANGNGVGKARDEPNQDPQLITPIDGRGWGDFLKGCSFAFKAGFELKLTSTELSRATPDSTNRKFVENRGSVSTSPCRTGRSSSS